MMMEVSLKGAKKDIYRRRGFLKFLSFTSVGTLIYPLYKFSTFNDNSREKVTIPLFDIKNEITKIKNYFIYKDDKNITIFDAHCTHMGCILNYNKDKKLFICPCHHSQFLKNGKKIKGPAKRNLDKISFKIKDKTIYIG